MAKKSLRTELITFRVRPELKAALLKRAEREHRSLSQLVEMVLEQAMRLRRAAARPVNPIREPHGRF
jgi:hypothetical protein